MVVPGIYDIWLTRHPWLFKYRGFPSVSLFLPELILFALWIWSRSAIEIYIYCVYVPSCQGGFPFPKSRGGASDRHLPDSWNLELCLGSIEYLSVFHIQ